MAPQRRLQAHRGPRLGLRVPDDRWRRILLPRRRRPLRRRDTQSRSRSASPRPTPTSSRGRRRRSARAEQAVGRPSDGDRLDLGGPHGHPRRSTTPRCRPPSPSPNQTRASVAVPTYGDAKHQGDRAVVLELSSPTGAALGRPPVTRLLITDDDALDPTLVEGLRVAPPTSGCQTRHVVALRQVNVGSPFALPGQSAPERVLSADPVGTWVSTDRAFAQPQDWSSHAALSFMYYGRGTGQPVRVGLQNTAAPAAGARSTVAWADEFSTAAGTRPNPSIWTTELGDGTIIGAPRLGNDELEYYTSSPLNASTDGAGHLVLTTRKTDPGTTLTCYYGPMRLHLGPARHGEEGGVRLRPDRVADPSCLGAPGSGPRSGRSAPTSARTRGRARVRSTSWSTSVGCPSGSSGPSTAPATQVAPPSAAPTTSPSTWPTATTSTASTGRPTSSSGRSTASVPPGHPSERGSERLGLQPPLSLLLNVAVGGNFGGTVGADTTFPQKMKVDYVRVYRPKTTTASYTTSFKDSSRGWRLVTPPARPVPRPHRSRGGRQPDLRYVVRDGRAGVPCRCCSTRSGSPAPPALRCPRPPTPAPVAA